MDRSKEMGKPVAELTPEELRRERSRCKSFIEIFGHTIGAKSLLKRLHAIDQRIASDKKED
jgi:hypothetical protein